MLESAYLLSKIGADTAENERNFIKIGELSILAEDREIQCTGNSICQELANSKIGKETDVFSR